MPAGCAPSAMRQAWKPCLHLWDVHGNGDQLVGIRVRQWPEQCCVDNAEDRGVRAHAQGKRADGSEREARTLTQTTEREPNVLTHLIDRAQDPHVTCFFNSQRDVPDSLFARPQRSTAVCERSNS